MNINELDELAKEATPGPWESEQLEDVHAIAWIGKIGVFPTDGTPHREWPDPEHDAAYIAAANPSAISELIAAYRESVAALIRIERGTDGVTQPYKWFSSLDIKEIAKEPIDTAKRLGVE